MFFVASPPCTTHSRRFGNTLLPRRAIQTTIQSTSLLELYQVNIQLQLSLVVSLRCTCLFDRFAGANDDTEVDALQEGYAAALVHSESLR
jgi:hypothetical protein